MQDIHQQFPADKFALLGVSRSPLEDQEMLCDNNGLTYYLGFDSGAMNDAYHIQAYPTLVLIDPDRHIIYQGHRLSEMYEILIRKMR